MTTHDGQIAAALTRLAEGEFDQELDWPTCFELVRGVVLRRKLSARDFAPTSQFGGANWTTDDLVELTGDWVCYIRRDRATRLLERASNERHLANSARVSVYHFILGGMRSTPRTDLWKALVEVLPEFRSLTAGNTSLDQWIPDTPFPWRHHQERSSRQRVVTSAEVRSALMIIASKRSSGWSRESLFKTLALWADLPENESSTIDEQSLEPSHLKRTGAPDSELVGREAAQALLRSLEKDEQATLCGFIIPNQVGQLSLEKAAANLGVSKSTLHDRAGRLQRKLASLECEITAELDGPALTAFFQEIMREPGNPEPFRGTE